jgi:5-methylcytosine-specific restriction enzyme subunit McrC
VLIETTDLSVIPGVGSAEDRWLRDVAQRATAGSLTLRFSPRDDEDDEPLLSFDARTGTWWTGRYVGELRLEDGVLRILPRFGVPLLQHWLSRIWGIRIISSLGQYEPSRVWLWELLAKIWEARLLSATKHGLPARRIDQDYVGRTVRGRLDVRSSAQVLQAGNCKLVSRSRNRSVDRHIASVVLCAFANLRTQLAHVGHPRVWLTPRALSLVAALQSQYGKNVTSSSLEFKKTIRYTPITEAYRPLVALSLSIVRQRPMSSVADGSHEVLGVLIDMAEVWELYVYNLLRSGIIGAEVVHTGRSREAEGHLLRSDKASTPSLGRLKPDIAIRSFTSGRLLSVLDAKYKSTVPSREKPFGVLREDLYQLNAYLSAFANPSKPLIGGLVYPAEPGAAISRLQAANAWYTVGTRMPFYFFGINGSSSTAAGHLMMPCEAALIESIQTLTRRAVSIWL